MLFNSIDFLVFFPVVTCIFFVIPKRIRYIWLLLASYYFYMSWNPKYAFLIALSTLVTYGSGLLIEKCAGATNAKKWCLAGGLAVCLCILFIFKNYANFLLENMNRIASCFGITLINRKIDLLLPVGISFYTFQALSYIVDVYRGNIKAERNVLKYALYVSFFPQLVAGPIERSENLLSQIQNIERIKAWDSERVKNGFMLMIWGLFQKLVIADRIALLVDKVINHYMKYGFVEIFIAIVLFAFQIYCDFGGYTSIARGAAQVLGFSLMNNFKQPYLAQNVKGFWKRWHISLTSWFSDYLYIPLGGNRKGIGRKYLNILIIFLTSGLWHGASWNFIIWGLIHAVYLIAEDAGKLLGENIAVKKVYHKSWGRMLREIVVTFVVVDFAWIFFMCNSLEHALNVIRQMFAKWYTSKNIFSIGLGKVDWIVLFFSIAVLTTIDILHEKHMSIFQLVKKMNFGFRWLLYLGLFWCVVIFGVWGQAYDTGDFIYFQF